ncbi:MAG: hypothetical protein EOP68_10855, partial [Sphingomonas sp.]
MPWRTNTSTNTQRPTLSRRTFAATLLAAAGVCLVPGSLRAQANGPILVGHFGSLTGSEATFGKSTSAGIRLAIVEVNAAGGIGGRKVELKEYDDKGEAREVGT